MLVVFEQLCNFKTDGQIVKFCPSVLKSKLWQFVTLPNGSPTGLKTT